jgi:alkanesulfonate monooxygenase SsuD/methylene tetrahydromethanopterin reductase-like flavin-dependent oxidoreductase (luciferase family)
MEAIEAYRAGFTPSKYLDRPYVMVGVPLVASETDAEARYLATSSLRRQVKLIRRQPIFIPPPVESMEGIWSEPEKFLVDSRMALAVIGGPETVRQKLAHILEDTGADELIFVSDLYDHARRLRSFEIAAEAVVELTSKLPQGM